jgi:quaternary ammonium compound-resistance protein SugE
MSTSTAWLILIVAGLLEIAWAVGMKYTGNWTRFWPSAFVVTAYLVDLYLLSIPMRRLPAGTAYTVWVGIGSVGVVLFGILKFGESASPMRIACLALIVAGVIGLKLLPAA